jgi:hypothetical protein
MQHEGGNMSSRNSFRFATATFGFFLSLLFVLQIPIHAQNYPACFMVDREGRLIDLSSICGSPVSKNELQTNNNANNNNSSERESEKNSFTQYNINHSPEQIRNALAYSEAGLQSIDRSSKVPNFMEGSMSQEQYQNRLKCQSIAERVNEDPSLLEPRTVSENALIPIGEGRYSVENIQQKDPLGSLGGTSVGIVNRCKYRL